MTVHNLPPKYTSQTNSYNITGRNHSMVILLLVHQDETPTLMSADISSQANLVKVYWNEQKSTKIKTNTKENGNNNFKRCSMEG